MDWNYAHIMLFFSVFGDVSSIETESESNTSGFRPIPVNSKPAKKKKNAIKREKLSITDECVDSEGVIVPPDVVKSTSGSPMTVKKVKNQNRKKKRTNPPITPKNKFQFVFPVTGETAEEKSPAKKKDLSKPVSAETVKQERQSNGESSENDEVFTTCQDGGALDMLANFASSASFEKEKKPEKESTLKGSLEKAQSE